MLFTKSPLRRGPNGRAAHTRFVEVEMPVLATSYLVIDMKGGGRIDFATTSVTAKSC